MYLLAVILLAIGLIMALVHIFTGFAHTNEVLSIVYKVSQLLLFASFYFLVSKAGSKREKSDE